MDLKTEKLPVNMSLTATDQTDFNKKVKVQREKVCDNFNTIFN